jgi:hypothetical protein
LLLAQASLDDDLHILGFSPSLGWQDHTSQLFSLDLGSWKLILPRLALKLAPPYLYLLRSLRWQVWGPSAGFIAQFEWCILKCLIWLPPSLHMCPTG